MSTKAMLAVCVTFLHSALFTFRQMSSKSKLYFPSIEVDDHNIMSIEGKDISKTLLLIRRPKDS